MDENKLETEQKENQPEISPATPTPPPETAAEADQRRLAELDTTIPPHEESAQRTEDQLEKVIDQLNDEPPRVEISKQNATAESLAQMREEKSEILARQEESGATTETEMPEPDNSEGKTAAAETSPEKQSELLQAVIEKALRDIPAEVNIIKATNPNLSAETIKKLPSLQKIRESFINTRGILPEQIDNKIIKISEDIATDLAANEVITPDKVTARGMEILDDEIKTAAEKPTEKEKSKSEETLPEKPIADESTPIQEQKEDKQKTNS